MHCIKLINSSIFQCLKILLHVLFLSLHCFSPFLQIILLQSLSLLHSLLQPILFFKQLFISKLISYKLSLFINTFLFCNLQLLQLLPLNLSFHITLTKEVLHYFNVTFVSRSVFPVLTLYSLAWLHSMFMFQMFKPVPSIYNRWMLALQAYLAPCNSMSGPILNR